MTLIDKFRRGDMEVKVFESHDANGNLQTLTQWNSVGPMAQIELGKFIEMLQRAAQYE